MRPEKGVLRYATSLQTAGHCGGGFRRRIGAYPRRLLLVEQQFRLRRLVRERRRVVLFRWLPNLSGTLNGSGSTFQLTFQQAAIAAFKSVQPGMTVNYGGGGSGKGRTDLAAGTVNFAGSDSPIPAEETSSFQGKTVLYFPVIVGPITVAYNLSGVSNLKLSGADHRGHLLGQDQDLERPGDQGGQLRASPAQHRDHHRRPLRLLGHHRRTSPSSWWRRRAAPGRLGSSSTINWPPPAGAGNGNAGVAQIVKSTPGAIGYVDYADRQGLRPDLRLGQEQGRHVRRTVAASRPRRPPTQASRQARPDLQRDLGARRQLLPDHLPVVGPGLPKQSERANTANCSRPTSATCSATARSCSPRLGYAPLPASLDQKAVAAAQQDRLVSGEYCDAGSSDRLVIVSTAARRIRPLRPDPPARWPHRRPLGDRASRSSRSPPACWCW